MVGRVCCDSEGRLNENSILLEGSLKFSQASWNQRSQVSQVAQNQSPLAATIGCHAQGGRVRLDMSRLEAYRLIPGQVIAVEGMNASGQCLTANRIISSVEPPAAMFPVQGDHCCSQWHQIF